MGLLIQGGNINHAAKVENGNTEMGIQAGSVNAAYDGPARNFPCKNSFGNITHGII